jgi:hypothetical protein
MGCHQNQVPDNRLSWKGGRRLHRLDFGWWRGFVSCRDFAHVDFDRRRASRLSSYFTLSTEYSLVMIGDHSSPPLSFTTVAVIRQTAPIGHRLKILCDNMCYFVSRHRVSAFIFQYLCSASTRIKNRCSASLIQSTVNTTSKNPHGPATRALHHRKYVGSSDRRLFVSIMV